jgi:hypothetical protein
MGRGDLRVIRGVGRAAMHGGIAIPRRPGEEATQRRVAEALQRDHPHFMVLWGCYTRRFWAYAKDFDAGSSRFWRSHALNSPGTASSFISNGRGQWLGLRILAMSSIMFIQCPLTRQPSGLRAATYQAA